MKLLNVGSNAKTVKGDILGEYLTGILYLAPAQTSSYQVCPSSTAGCRASCLFTAGRGKMNSVQEARVRKTKMFFEQREEFKELLFKDIFALVSKAKKNDVKPAVRLNGTSDIHWTKIYPDLLTEFSEVMFYGYTKEKKFMEDFMGGNCPPNYYLTFSRSENNWEYCKTILDRKFTVACVFHQLPKKYEGYKVFDADKTDLRFTDPKGQIAGLKAKGKAKHDKSGFVIQ